MQKGYERAQVLHILKQYGNDSLSYFHLQDDRNYFFSPKQKSFLSYKIYNKIALVSSDPIGPPEERDQLIQSFTEYCNIWNFKICFISISEELKTYLSEKHFKVKRIGEEAYINLDTFERQLLKKRVRRAVKHSENLGIEIIFYTAHTIPTFILEQLESISNEWIQYKGKKEKGYSMTLKRIPNKFDLDCLISVAVKENKVIGFSTFIPIYQRTGFSLDLIRKTQSAPNGLNEFLIIKTLEYLKTKYVKVVTLNFAAFVFTFPSTNKVKVLVSNILAYFFKCNDLYSFNNKFAPIWKTRYISFLSYIDFPFSLTALLQAEM